MSAATFTWTGAGDGVSWNDEQNWDDGDGFLPGDGFPDDATDDVIINAGTPQVNVDVTTGNVTINGGNLTINLLLHMILMEISILMEL